MNITDLSNIKPEAAKLLYRSFSIFNFSCIAMFSASAFIVGGHHAKLASSGFVMAIAVITAVIFLMTAVRFAKIQAALLRAAEAHIDEKRI